MNGIHFAMSFLQSWQQQQQENKEPNYEKLQALVKNKRVIIIGGGDTAVDCIATALRQVILKINFLIYTIKSLFC